MHKNINVTKVTTTYVEVTCERCKKKTEGTCPYANIEMFVKEKLKFATIHVDRSVKSNYPKNLLVCMDCLGTLTEVFEQGKK